jgi:hypothetical protein
VTSRFSSVAALSAVVVVVSVAPPALARTSAVANSLEIVSVNSVRGAHALQASKTNVVRATSDLAFRVALRNTTAHQRQHVTVTLFIRQGPMTNIWKRLTIDTFAPHQRKSVTFANLGQVAFAVREKMKITVRTDSKAHVSTYQLIFALG